LKENSENLSVNDEEKKNQEGMSRRSFLVGAGTVVAGTVIGGGLLAGCTTETTTTKTEVVTTSKTATTTVEVPTTVLSTVTTTKTEGGTTGGTVTTTVTETGTESTPSFLIPLDPPDSSKVINTVTADVVIVGSGNSGLACACKLSESGKTVVVVEERDDPGEFSIWTKDFGCINSRFAMETKGCDEYDPMEFMFEHMKQEGFRCRPSLIRDYAKRSGEVCDYMMDNFCPPEDWSGYYVYMGPANDLYKEAFPDGRVLGDKYYFGCVSLVSYETYEDGSFKYRDWNSKPMFMNAYQHCLDNGVVWYWSMSAEQLIKVDDRVTGVYAYDADGNYTKFMANEGVVLACGDMSGNSDMLAHYAVEANIAIEGGTYTRRTSGGMGGGMLFNGVSTPSASGQGMLMAIWAGGKMQYGPLSHFSSGTAAFSIGGCHPCFGADGKRFANEFESIKHARTKLKGGLNCIVADANWATISYLTTTTHGAGIDCGDGAWDYVQECMANIPVDDPAGGYVPWTAGNGFGPENDAGSAGNVFAASTLDNLADMIGYTGDAKTAFLAEIAHYNEMCYSTPGTYDYGKIEGLKDTDFGRPNPYMQPIEEPPFYFVTSDDSSRSAGTASFTCGGVMVDDNQQVVDVNDDPIPGLYATGFNAGDKMPMDYVCLTSGNAMGMAWTHGYILGEYLGNL
jgi:succinate dehydrogenase/fumarate reductase flavoprotein subunit